MIKSKIFDVFGGFSKDELKKFGNYLRSPLFNKRKVIYTLFEIYRKYYPDFSDRNLSKEKVFSRIFPGKKFSDEILRNLNSILLKHAEEFLSFLNYSGDPFTVKKHLLYEINHRNLLTIFAKNFEESRKISEKSVRRDLDYFYNEYDLFHQKDIYNSIINKFSKEDITFSEKNLIAFFVMKLLEIENYILYENRILNLDKSLYLRDTFIDELLKKVPDDITQMPQIQIYYNTYKLEQTSDEKYYNKLKTLLNKFGDMIGKEKHYNNYQVMIDYIKRTKSIVDIKTNSELFHLRKEIIEKDLIMENTITNMFFMNLVKSGLRLKEFDWIYNFINNYQSYLIPKYREITRDLSLALYNFEKKNYNESLSYAALVRFEDNFYNLEVKNLTSRIYFEMNEFEALVNLMNSYSMYLAKNRSIDLKTKQSHAIFISCMNKLIKIKELRKSYKLDAISSQIENKDIVNKYWIVDKIYELM